MKYSTTQHEKYQIIILQEEKLTSTVAPELKSKFVMLNAQGIDNVILDLSEVQYADSSGLSSLLRANSMFEQAGGIFVLCALTDHVEKLIKITHLDRVLPIVPTRQEAIEAVFMHEIEKDIEDDDDDDDDEA